MPNNDVVMRMIAQVRHEELLAEAERRCLLRRFQQNQKSSSWHQLRWQAGRVLVALGQRLQTQVESHEMMH